ncbi:MAG: FAD:protein FMN transferase [Halieaceae bacterium]|jgi:thiamine biosynthesis lipoprotein|nr:FAD:protein FMN transferase [Halieaceae bacterium]
MTLAVNLLRWLLLGLVLGLSGCETEQQPIRLSGGVFGTTWSLTYTPGLETPDPDAVRSALEGAFNIVNQQMNHYDPDSTLSVFNRAPVGEFVEVGWDFAYVLTEAMRISAATNHAYDITLSPVSDLWGFGPEGPEHVPTDDEILQALQRVGLDKLEWVPQERLLAKRVEGVAIDFSSIAKGYGVDLGADALDELGVVAYMLEIGGEIRLRGPSPRGDLWRIAIERPVGTERRDVQAAVAATDTGIATSGDYRNFFEVDGVRYSHLLDPRSGRPIQHDLVSVTVIHPSTAIADAWATALIVLGYDAARALADEQDLAVYFVRHGDAGFGVEWTEPMANYLVTDGR